MSINGGRTAIALVVIGAYLIWRRHPLKLNRWVVVGALSVFGCNALFSVANKMTTAANAIVLQFTAPIFVLLFSILLFGKRPTRLDIVTCLLVFGGILFFFLDSLEKGNNIGNVIALLSGIAYAGVFLMNELPGGDAISSVFWGDVLSAMTGLPFLLQETEFSATGVGSLIVLGVFQVGLAYILLTEGLKTTPAVTASLVSGIEPVLNPVLVAVFYREFIGAMSFVGAVVVVGSVIGYNVLLARQKSSV
jgi:drug/metabolite transporter (DMT)-like permease